MNNEREIKKGQIYWVDFPKTKYMLEGIRPGLILSNDIGNKGSSSVLVCPCTTKSRKELPVHVRIENIGTTALIEEITCVDKETILGLVGEVDWRKMREINTAILIEFGII